MRDPRNWSACEARAIEESVPLELREFYHESSINRVTLVVP
jgi:hypothetical protein